MNLFPLQKHITLTDNRIASKQKINTAFANSSTMKKGLMMLMAVGTLFVTGCDANKPATNDVKNELAESQDLNANAQIFSGCYTATKGLPAQIKVSQQGDGLVMQMKEPRSANRVWDDPEPLEILPLEQVSKYFGVDNENVTNVIARPDGLFALSHVKSEYVNINPLFDSKYLVFILNLDNTIYKVECDDIYSDEVTTDDKQNIRGDNSNNGQVSLEPVLPTQ